MRIPIILLCLFLSITSCNDSKKEKDSEATSSQNESIEINNDKDTSNRDQPLDRNNPNSQNEDDTEDVPEENTTKSSGAISGVYVKNDHLEDTSCKCFCIDVSTSGSSELCLKEDDLYIKARFQPNGNNIDIYYSGKSARTSNEEIPWDEFETGTPIAVLNPTANGFKLDWKGFSINGEIAIDYALYGKKTLEGSYKKK
ncbi:hypothetical protein [Christiangramia forsetii]|uniref:Uncharacterized protein n=2 Tax=Christiangramia forsetii TaxID=411153 RepID=A0M4X0_CHRFK|nr:hypothetical protein [Christiangramia forsetii]GGG22450.1 hypothetical protein GCM10011532_01840 [Christiangramia forsetii]CAL67665.1 conserved hypothetical protein [Christiangramia forsetii KT0803]